MNKAIFEERKQELAKLISESLAKDFLTESDTMALRRLSDVLNQYTYENRLHKKGLLSHTIIDSLELEYSLGERFIEFDNGIK